MKKYILILFTIILNSANAEETKPILVKKTGAYQLNTDNEKNNEAVTSYPKLIKNCFSVSSDINTETLDYNTITNYINSKINESDSIPTIECNELITAYKAKKENK